MAYKPLNHNHVIIPKPAHVFSLTLTNNSNTKREIDLYDELKNIGVADDDVITGIRMQVSDENQFGELFIIANTDMYGNVQETVLPIRSNPINFIASRVEIQKLYFIIGRMNKSRFNLISNCTIQLYFEVIQGIGERKIKAKEKDVEREIHDALSEIKLENNNQNQIS